MWSFGSDVICLTPTDQINETQVDAPEFKHVLFKLFLLPVNRRYPTALEQSLNQTKQAEDTHLTQTPHTLISSELKYTEKSIKNNQRPVPSVAPQLSAVNQNQINNLINNNNNTI